MLRTPVVPNLDEFLENFQGGGTQCFLYKGNITVFARVPLILGSFLDALASLKPILFTK